MAVILTLLLTSTAFKFVYAERLPKVDYLTRMDWYMNCTLILLLIQTAIHVYVFVAIDRFDVNTEELQRVEEVGLACLLCLWTAIHSWFWKLRKAHIARRVERSSGILPGTTGSREEVIIDEWELASVLDDTSSMRSGVTNISVGGYDD
eukprot:COSAG02_NODE_2887_length_7807_cov_622.088350_2_plen_149_part_00